MLFWFYSIRFPCSHLDRDINLVFMNNSWWYHLPLAVVIIFEAFRVNCKPAEVHDEEAGDLPEDFVKYVQELGASVFKMSEKPSPQMRFEKPTIKNHNTSTVQYRRKQPAKISKSTQSAALRDILMLKLVSYYEDKYKLSRSEFTTTRTTQRLALEELFDKKYSQQARRSNTHKTSPRRTIARRRNEAQTVISRSVRRMVDTRTGATMYGPAAEVVVI